MTHLSPKVAGGGVEANTTSVKQKESVVVSGGVTVSLLLSFLLFPGVVVAQTERAFQGTDVHGQSTRVPYPRHEEYQNISLIGSSASGKSPKQSADASLKFGQLLSVASLDEVTRRLGEPKSIERRDLSGNMFIGILHYDGLRLEYLKTGTKEIRLRKLDISSPGWSVTINGKELHPGMEISQLSTTVRESIKHFERSPSDNPDVDAAAVLHVANKTKGKSSDRLEENTRFSFRIDTTAGTIEAIGFNRLI